MTPEEFRKKYGLDLFGPPPQGGPGAAPTAMPPTMTVPGDVRQLFPGNVPGAPLPPPASDPAARPASPFLTGTDPAAQEAQAAFFEKFGFPMFPGVPQGLLPQQPEPPPGRQVPGGPRIVAEPTAIPTSQVRPDEGQMPIPLTEFNVGPGAVGFPDALPMPPGAWGMTPGGWGHPASLDRRGGAENLEPHRL